MRNVLYYTCYNIPIGTRERVQMYINKKLAKAFEMNETLHHDYEEYKKLLGANDTLTKEKLEKWVICNELFAELFDFVDVAEFIDVQCDYIASIS